MKSDMHCPCKTVFKTFIDSQHQFCVRYFNSECHPTLPYRLLKLAIPEEYADKGTERKDESEKADEAGGGEEKPSVEESEKDTPRTEGQEESGKDSHTDDKHDGRSQKKYTKTS